MRVAVFSDSHGYRGRLSNLLMMLEAEGPLDAIIHLGDGDRDLYQLGVELPPVYQVSGNCDFMPDCLLQEVHLGNARILITHGHHQNVKTDRERLLRLASQYRVHAALFGHTHSQWCDSSSGILLLNPGAAMDGHCALLEINHLGGIAYRFY